MKIKPSKSRIAFQIFNYTLMLLATFVCVYPFWYIVIYTFSDAAKAGIKNPVFLPRGFSVSNYVDIFKLSGFFPHWEFQCSVQWWEPWLPYWYVPSWVICLRKKRCPAESLCTVFW